LERLDRRLPSGASRAQSNEHELALLHRVQVRDRAAFQELYYLYHRRLARFLPRMTRHYEVAEEVINDTMWVVWQRAGDFRGSSQVSTWIMGIAYRRALRALRDERQIATTDRRLSETAVPDSDDSAGAADMQDWISRGLAELPEEQRLTLEMAYFLGHSCEEIAAITGAPVGTVKARMFHAREKLRIRLPSLGGLPPRSS